MDPLNFHPAEVVTNPVRAVANSDDEILNGFLHFLDNFRQAGDIYLYKDRLRDMTTADSRLTVVFEHLQAFNSDLADRLTRDPVYTLRLLRGAVAYRSPYHLGLQASVPPAGPQGVPPPRQDPKVIIIHSSIEGTLKPSTLNASHINKLISMRATVTGSSRLRSKTDVAVAKCRACGHVYSQHVPQGLESIQLPSTCQRERQASDSRNECGPSPYVLSPQLCGYIDIQTLKLQDTPGDTQLYNLTSDPTAVDTAELNKANHDTPLILSAVLEDHLCDGDLIAGFRVIATGVLMSKATSKAIYLLTTGVYRLVDDEYSISSYLNSFSRLGMAGGVAGGVVGGDEPALPTTVQSQRFTPAEIASFKRFAASPGVVDNITNSICPQILGMANAKLAIACLLFGGSTKYTAEQMRLRGDINVLLISDPGLGKSEMLQWTAATAPIGIFTSGKSTSAVGLTAGVMRDKATGEFYLEGGALVLADNGLVCIDEVDKMSEKDRVALHEAMEQGSVSVSKAGITATLNTRTSILAAANPVLGRFDDFKRAADQLDFSSTILSRFDLIFILKDRADARMDARIVDQIGRITQNAFEPPADAAPADFLKRYIAYAREAVAPKLNADAVSYLKSQYIKVRGRSLEGSGGIPITVRQLEAMVRISEAFAKMALRENVTTADVESSISIFTRSTADAASSGLREVVAGDRTMMRSIAEAEKAIKSLVPRGSFIQERALLRDLGALGLSEGSIVHAITLLIKTGVLERQRSRQLKRL